MHDHPTRRKYLFAMFRTCKYPLPGRRQTLSMAAILIALTACAKHPELKSFASDGCSLFPDRDTQRGESWCGCCVEHDFAYWQGGPESARQLADKALSECVFKKTGDSVLAEVIYAGTRTGGSSHFPTWYRWGYGWPYKMDSLPDTTRVRLIREKRPVDLAAIAKDVCKE